MSKKIKVEGNLVEETAFYRVIKSNENGKFYIFSKYDDTMYIARQYKIIGAAVLENNYGQKYYSNFINPQAFGQGRCLAHRWEIDSWETKVVNGKEQTMVKYLDEKGFKYIRCIDQEGNLYKKNKQAKKVEEDVVSL